MVFVRLADVLVGVLVGKTSARCWFLGVCVVWTEFVWWHLLKYAMTEAGL